MWYGAPWLSCCERGWSSASSALGPCPQGPARRSSASLERDRYGERRPAIRVRRDLHGDPPSLRPGSAYCSLHLDRSRELPDRNHDEHGLRERMAPVAGRGDADAGYPHRSAGCQVEREVAATVVAQVHSQRHAECPTYGRSDEGPGEPAELVVFGSAVAGGGRPRQAAGEEPCCPQAHAANDRSSFS